MKDAVGILNEKVDSKKLITDIAATFNYTRGTFDEHVTNKVRIANALLGKIRRSFSYLDAS